MSGNVTKPERLVRGTVLVVCPGGLEHGGGIGRQMGYFLNAPGLQTLDWDYRALIPVVHGSWARHRTAW
jgi:hypothetical protein